MASTSDHSSAERRSRISRILVAATGAFSYAIDRSIEGWCTRRILRWLRSRQFAEFSARELISSRIFEGEEADSVAASVAFKAASIAIVLGVTVQVFERRSCRSA